MPTVTIGLPVYNAAPYLADAIQSVINQSFTDWELIIVDDGSTDESLAIARSFDDCRIRVIADGRNLRLSNRLNQITREAQSAFIARMDADDIMLPARLQLQMAYLEQHPEVDVVSSYLYVIDIKNTICGIRGSTQMPQTLAEAIWGVPIAHPTVLARKDWFLANPYNPQNFRGQDIELWLATIDTSRFQVIPKPLLFYREIGIPYVKKYLQTSKSFRALLKKYSHQLGQRKVIPVLLASFAKDSLYKLVSLFNREYWLLRRRSQPLLLNELEQAQKLLNQSIRRNLTQTP